MGIKAVIFDVDGTILDTREFIMQGFEHALAAHGHAVPPRSHIMASASGVPLPDSYVTLAPNGDVLALCNTHGEFQSRHFELVVAYEGLEEVLKGLRDRGIVLGLCTSRHHNLEKMLGHASVTHYFDAIVGGTDVTHHKPHPEGVLKVLEQIKIAPEHVAMIGDTTADIGAGRAAYLTKVIGITHGFANRETLENAGAHAVIDSLRELPALIC